MCPPAPRNLWLEQEEDEVFAPRDCIHLLPHVNAGVRDPRSLQPESQELPVRGDILAKARALESRRGLRSLPSLRLQSSKFQRQGRAWTQQGIPGRYWLPSWAREIACTGLRPSQETKLWEPPSAVVKSSQGGLPNRAPSCPDR